MKLFRTLVLIILIGAAVWAYLFLAPYGPAHETFVDVLPAPEPPG